MTTTKSKVTLPFNSLRSVFSGLRDVKVGSKSIGKAYPVKGGMELMLRASAPSEVYKYHGFMFSDKKAILKAITNSL